MKLGFGGALLVVLAGCVEYEDGQAQQGELACQLHQLCGSLVTLGYGKAAETESLDGLSLRLSKYGKLDTTYGDQGVARVDCAGFNDNGRSVLTLPDGKILLMGSGRSDASSADAMLALLTKDGVADPSFGPSGKRVFDLGGTGDQFWGAALSPDKKRVVIVGTKGSSTTNDDAAVLVLPTP